MKIEKWDKLAAYTRAIYFLRMSLRDKVQGQCPRIPPNFSNGLNTDAGMLYRAHTESAYRFKFHGLVPRVRGDAPTNPEEFNMWMAVPYVCVPNQVPMIVNIP